MATPPPGPHDENSNQALQQTPSYFSTLRNKTSQFSLRSIHLGARSNPSHTADGINVHDDLTLRPASEHTTFGWPRPSSRYGAIIRLDDDGGDRGLTEDVEIAAADSSVTRRRTGMRSRGVERWLKRRPLLRAGLQISGIFIVSTLLLGGTLWLALPKLEE